MDSVERGVNRPSSPTSLLVRFATERRLSGVTAEDRKNGGRPPASSSSCERWRVPRKKTPISSSSANGMSPD